MKTSKKIRNSFWVSKSGEKTEIDIDKIPEMNDKEIEKWFDKHELSILRGLVKILAKENKNLINKLKEIKNGK